MANKNYWRQFIGNDYLGETKLITAPTKYELDMKIERQYQIWNEKVQRQVQKQNKEQMKYEAERLTKIDKQKIDSYANMIKSITKQINEKYYSSMKDINEYAPFSTNLVEPCIEMIYKELMVPEKSILEKLSPKKRENREKKEKEAMDVYKYRCQKYAEAVERERVEYEKRKNKFYSEQNEKNEVIKEAQEQYKKGKIQEIEKYHCWVLENSIYPQNFIKDFEVQYIEDTKTLIVSYYLPNTETIPKIIEHKYVASRNEITEISFSEKKFENFYNEIIYMCCLKTIKEIFISDDMNFIENVVYNGWIRYIDKSIGKETESCILTVETTREKFLNINLEKVDYKECIKGLKGLFAPSILSLTPVMPYMNINREDSRFIESKDIESITFEGCNLATMPWEDFEYFVRELFDKMFNVNGGEVKVTQASHDGGVDAIAFDDDPIRGGKFVIQAKRYNNVVPVSAVRDLYGTMIHEGATKGILVTTSSYGKDSYEFAKDKPIKLINGQELLGLLEKYGYKNLTIKTKK